MPSARCPDCDTLRDITPTGEKIGESGSATWWRISMHKHPAKPEVCTGSGKKV